MRTRKGIGEEAKAEPLPMVCVEKGMLSLGEESNAIATWTGAMVAAKEAAGKFSLILRQPMPPAVALRKRLRNSLHSLIESLA